MLLFFVVFMFDSVRIQGKHSNIIFLCYNKTKTDASGSVSYTPFLDNRKGESARWQGFNVSKTITMEPVC